MTKTLKWAAGLACLLCAHWAQATPTISKSYTTDTPEPLGVLGVVHYQIEVTGLESSEDYWIWDILDEGMSVQPGSIDPIPYAQELGLDGRTYILWSGYAGGSQTANKTFTYDATVFRGVASERLCNQARLFEEQSGPGQVDVQIGHADEGDPFAGEGGDDRRNRDPRDGDADSRSDEVEPPEPVDPTDPPGRQIASTEPICVQVVIEPSITKTIVAPTDDFQRIGQLVTYEIELSNLIPGTATDPNPYIFIESVDPSLMFESITASDPGLAEALVGWENNVVVVDGRRQVEVEFVATQASSTVIVAARVLWMPEDSDEACNTARIENPHAPPGGQKGAGDEPFVDESTACLKVAQRLSITKTIAGYSAIQGWPYDGVDPGPYQVLENQMHRGDLFDEIVLYDEPIRISNGTFNGFFVAYDIKVMEGDAVADLTGTEHEYQITDYAPFPHCFHAAPTPGTCNDAFSQPVRSIFKFYPDGDSAWIHDEENSIHSLIITNTTSVDAYNGHQANGNDPTDTQSEAWNVPMIVPRDSIMEAMGVNHAAFSGIALSDIFDGEFTVDPGTTIQLCNVVGLWDRHEVEAAGGATLVDPIHRSLVCIDVMCDGVCTHSIAGWQYDVGRILWSLVPFGTQASNLVQILDFLISLGDAIGSRVNNPNNPIDCPWHDPECFDWDFDLEPEWCPPELELPVEAGAPGLDQPPLSAISRAEVLIAVPTNALFPVFGEADAPPNIEVVTGDTAFDVVLEGAFADGEWRSSSVFDLDDEPVSLSLGVNLYFVTVSATFRQTLLDACLSSTAVTCEGASGGRMVPATAFADPFASSQVELDEIFAERAWSIIDVYTDVTGCPLPQSTVGVIEAKFIEPHADQAPYLPGFDAGQQALDVDALPMTVVPMNFDFVFEGDLGEAAGHGALVSSVLNMKTDNNKSFASFARNAVDVLPIETHSGYYTIQTFTPDLEGLNDVYVEDIVLLPSGGNEVSVLAQNNGPYCIAGANCDLAETARQLKTDSDYKVRMVWGSDNNDQVTIMTNDVYVELTPFEVQFDANSGSVPSNADEGSTLLFGAYRTGNHHETAIYAALRYAILYDLPVLSASFLLEPTDEQRPIYDGLLTRYGLARGLIFVGAGNDYIEKPGPIAEHVFDRSHGAVVTVAGTAKGGTALDADSRRGPEVMISAPYHHLLADPEGGFNAGAKAAGGTSLATPMVAGVYAIVNALGGDILDLLETADISETDGAGVGRLNFCKAVAQVTERLLLKRIDDLEDEPDSDDEVLELVDAIDLIRLIADTCVP